MDIHLWEVNHRYYCNDGNYFSNDCHTEYKSWHDFISYTKDEDVDLNLVFRWDFVPITDDDENPLVIIDKYYRGYLLKLYYIGQRKGLFRYVHIEVCQADEDEIKKFLLGRWELLKEIWEPVSMIRENE